MNKAIERFLKYISFETTSNEFSDTVPSTPSQLAFADILVKECEEIGLSDIRTKNGYVYARLPKNADNFPSIGFIAHMDTSPDASGKNVKPNIVKEYDGSDIKFENGKVLSPNDFPELKNYIGQDIITTDGNTLLGADDKAGIAEIMTAVEYLKNHNEIEHGDVLIGFTPDEEIGRGADEFDVKNFGADFAYTMDGGKIGELEFENFNAARARIKIHGRNVHPGYGKDTMINASLIGAEFAMLLPPFETPSNTEKYEGFYHLCSIKGDVEECELTYILRDFDTDGLENRKSAVKEAADCLRAKFGDIIDVEIHDEYQNMYEKLRDKMYIVDLAEKSMIDCNINPIKQPIRGGTDGARLSFMGLICPNIFAGGHNFHGVYEYIPVNSIKKAAELIVKICSNAKGVR